MPGRLHVRDASRTCPDTTRIEIRTPKKIIRSAPRVCRPQSAAAAGGPAAGPTAAGALASAPSAYAAPREHTEPPRAALQQPHCCTPPWATHVGGRPPLWCVVARPLAVPPAPPTDRHRYSLLVGGRCERCCKAPHATVYISNFISMRLICRRPTHCRRRPAASPTPTATSTSCLRCPPLP